MDIKKKAMNFAIQAHDGQFRKAELEKPVVYHAIDVANKLENYGYDDNVIAAGYLHDTIEDTKVKEEDILKEFGSDVCSLVVGASEKDKTLSWEERKSSTIKRVKNLDLRHKAVVTCDKISNMEDLRYKIGREGKIDLSAFNRGKSKKIWYWQEVYKSLIHNEKENLPMFIKLNQNLKDIEKMFNNNIDYYYPDIDIFNENLETDKVARTLHYQKLELLKLKSILQKLNNPNSYVVEFAGSSTKEKEILINKLKTYFMLSGFNVKVIKDFTQSPKYLKEIYPKIINDSNKNKAQKIATTKYVTATKNTIPSCILRELNETKREQDYDIILIDKSLFDRLIWVEILYQRKTISTKEYKRWINNYLSIIKNKINLVVALENKNSKEYNQALNSNLEIYIKQGINIHKNSIYSTLTSDIILNICNYIMNDMKVKNIEQSLKTLAKVKKNN